jgi:O-antigen/teichoic acid export membrane protein
MTIFSEINYDKNPENYKKTFYQFFKYLSLIVCIFTAIFYYFIKVYINIIYSEVYSIVLLIIPIYIFQTFSRLTNRNLLVLAYSTNNTRISTYYSIIQTVNNLIVTYISLVFFDFTTLIIFYLAASYLLNILTILLIRKIVGFKINVLKLISPFLIYIVSFLITLPFTYFIKVQLFPLVIFNDVFNGAVYFLIFIISFYILIYITKFITREEFSQLITIMPGKRFRSRFIQKTIEKLAKLFPSKKAIS